MESRGLYIGFAHLFVRNRDAGLVLAFIKGRLHDQPFAGPRRGNQVDDHLDAHQWLPSPVLGDETEQAMLHLVPLTRARREVAHRQFQAGLRWPGPVARPSTVACGSRICPRRPRR
jgi:hypothetical protein